MEVLVLMRSCLLTLTQLEQQNDADDQIGPSRTRTILQLNNERFLIRSTREPTAVVASCDETGQSSVAGSVPHDEDVDLLSEEVNQCLRSSVIV